MIGLYIHIPFCMSKCRYCDFASFTNRRGDMKKYVDAVIDEARAYSGERADTVFIGGGTPSTLDEGLMTRLVDGVAKSICIEKNAEFTVEANPNSLTRNKAREYAALGVNRLSIGLQAAQERLLKRIGRTHTLADFYAAIDCAHNAGIDNVNADMIYSLPEQTVEDVVETARVICKTGVKHVSAYSLILEEGTPMFDEQPELPDDETDRRMFYAIVDELKKHGIERYEISNFAKRGYECAHNLKYWRVQDYIGLGTAAHSCYRGRRFFNADTIEGYLENKGKKPAEGEPQELLKEKIMLNLRLCEGILLDDMPKTDAMIKRLNEFIKTGFAYEKSGRFILTDKGMDIQNYIVRELFEILDN